MHGRSRHTFSRAESVLHGSMRPRSIRLHRRSITSRLSSSSAKAGTPATGIAVLPHRRARRREMPAPCMTCGMMTRPTAAQVGFHPYPPNHLQESLCAQRFARANPPPPGARARATPQRCAEMPKVCPNKGAPLAAEARCSNGRTRRRGTTEALSSRQAASASSKVTSFVRR